MQIAKCLVYTVCLVVLATGASAQTIEKVFGRVHRSVLTITTASRTVGKPGGPQVAGERGVGSGVVISKDGLVMTASHVVHTSDAVGVVFFDGELGHADVISSDPMTDLALIRVRDPLPDDVAIAPLGDSNSVKIGSQVFVVGSPRGMSHTLTVGYLSARRRSPQTLQGLIDIELFQTDASVNPGNSGGPMFNLKGEVIGIVSHIVSVSGGHEGLGFAITSNTARQVLLEAPPFWSGLDTVVVTGDLARALNIPGTGGGVLIQRVAMGSAGYHMGLRGGTIEVTIEEQEIVLGGDIIVEAVGVPIQDATSVLQVRNTFGDLKAGDEFKIVILRNGKRLEVIGRLPKDYQPIIRR